MREDLGCDGAASEDLYTIGCSRCGGDDPGCDRCGGTGVVGMRVCPGRLIGDRLDVYDCVDAYSQYHARQTLPAPGGWFSQSEAFVKAVRIIDSERARIDNAEPEEDRDARIRREAAERTARYERMA